MEEILHKRFDRKRLTGNEVFTDSEGKDSGLTVLDYWQWAYSELIETMQRGALAEYIVKMSLEKAGFIGEKPVRLNLELYDLQGPQINDGNGGQCPCRIEVKSASSVNSWERRNTKFSPIFRIAKSQLADSEAGYVNKEEGIYSRHSDLYVFCVFDPKDRDLEETVPAKTMLDLKDWSFYLVETEKITKECGNNATISFKKLLELTDNDKQPYMFETLGPAIIQKCKELKRNDEEPVKVYSKEKQT